MKKTYFKIIFFLLFLIFNFRVFAQDKISTNESGIVIDNKEIENFKEKIANKVAEIQKKNGKEDLIAGFVTKKDSKQITIVNSDNQENYIIKLEELLTKFYQISGKTVKEVNFDKIDKDSYLIAVGIKEDKFLTANRIYIDENFILKTGQISEIDKEKYQLELITAEKTNYLLDIETTTKQFIINSKTNQIEAGGFSKVKQGDFVSFIAKRENYDVKNNQYSAFKILVIPQEFFVK